MEDKVRVKKRSALGIVPWEPCKPAISAYARGNHPGVLPLLIKYQFVEPNPVMSTKKTELGITNSHFSESIDSEGAETSDLSRERPVGDGKESSLLVENVDVGEEESTNNVEELKRLKKDLELERQLTEELKRILVATMGDDLTCHVKSLSEDKVRLAHMMTKFEAQLSHDHDRAEDLTILADMWRCKFLAMSIRADEMRNQRYRLFSYCKQLQALLNEFLVVNQEMHRKFTSPALEALLKEARAVLETDLSTFFERSPCDEKLMLMLIVHYVIKTNSLVHFQGGDIFLVCSFALWMAAPTERFHVLSQLDHLQSKYTGTGHADTTRWEWLVNQHRDTYASMIGHPDHLSLIAVCENESRARVRFNLLNQMIAPCGPPPEKSALDD
ncbi:unnamed protein product [Litomosoides sigmodontis]|uniref:Splicing factor 3B subunit 5 n=1 Tax=Litomosoides sigmodontis TaxID=42156 RepID=A0A3P6TW91_LITSI|nr:unnamed protein product [Litomosoides sigmodontis]